MSVVRFTRRTAPQDRLDHTQWSTVSTEDFDPQAQRRFTLLTLAIKNYIAGEPFDDELRKDGIYRQTLSRSFNRCITTDGQGRLFGWRGLCPWLRVRAPERVKPLIACGRSKRGGLTGALTLFFSQHSKIASEFEQYLLANAKRATGYEARVREKSATRSLSSYVRTKVSAKGSGPYVHGDKAVNRFDSMCCAFWRRDTTISWLHSTAAAPRPAPIPAKATKVVSWPLAHSISSK